MKAPSDDETDTTIESESDAKKRFRFNRKPMEGDLDQLDELVAQVDQLQSTRPVPAREPGQPAPDIREIAAGTARPVPHPAAPTPAPTARRTEPRLAAAPRPVPAPAPTPQVAAPADTMSTTALGIDVNRILGILEEEAQQARRRIEHEVASAQSQAEGIVNEAKHDGDRIREHAQHQARILLSEVEEIITEAQQTGQQILRRADEEAQQVHHQAQGVLAQAQKDARTIIDTGRREGENILAEQRRLATVRAQEALREQDRIKDQIHRLEERRRQVLESLEPLIDQLSQMIPAEKNVIQLPRREQR